MSRVSRPKDAERSAAADRIHNSVQAVKIHKPCSAAHGAADAATGQLPDDKRDDLTSNLKKNMTGGWDHEGDGQQGLAT